MQEIFIYDIIRLIEKITLDMSAFETPLAANDNSSPEKGELDRHFESEIEAQNEAIVEVWFQYKNWIQRSRMTPDELYEYINAYRAHIVDEVEKAA